MKRHFFWEISWPGYFATDCVIQIIPCVMATTRIDKDIVPS